MGVKSTLGVKFEGGRKYMARAIVNETLCKGCGMCVIACPKKILVLSPDKINSKGYHPAELVDQSKCTGCAACAIMCPDVAIIVER
jgi:2-oxoglutarate ferredoxin oxidoreductase subunit delta